MNSSTKSSRSGTKVSTRSRSKKRSTTRRKQTANGRSTSASKGAAKLRGVKSSAKKKVAKKIAVPEKTPRKKAAPPFERYRMSPIELRDICARVLPDIRQEDVGELLMVAPRTMRRWLKGDAKIDGGATVVLRFLRAGVVTLDQVRVALGQSPGVTA
jgi:hypothetical protein